jgi:hypothetical protein
MAQDDMISADDHETTFKVLADTLFDDVMQLFAFLLLINHQFLLKLNLEFTMAI